MSDRQICMLIAAYLIGFMITFGHAMNNPTLCNDADPERQARCERMKVEPSMGVSIFWPLYWSTQAFK